MNRRGFLRLIGLGTAAALVPPVNWLGDSRTILSPLAPTVTGVQGVTLLGLKDIAMGVLNHLVRNRDRDYYECSDAGRIGTDGLTHQFGVDIDVGNWRRLPLRCSVEEFDARVLQPTAMLLTNELRHRQIRRIGSADFPRVPASMYDGFWVRDHTTNLAVRAVRAYDVTEARERLRIDILGGA